MKNLRHFTVTADRVTCEWIGTPHFTGRYVDSAEWVKMADTDAEHYDAFERFEQGDECGSYGTRETCAITVVWQD